MSLYGVIGYHVTLSEGHMKKKKKKKKKKNVYSTNDTEKIQIK